MTAKTKRQRRIVRVGYDIDNETLQAIEEARTKLAAETGYEVRTADLVHKFVREGLAAYEVKPLPPAAE